MAEQGTPDIPATTTAPASGPASDTVGAALGSLTTLRDGLAAGRWTPVDVVEAVITRRSRGQAAAWIDHVAADDLRAAAARLAEEGPRDRPLWGVPVAVKGNIDVAGLPTTAACPGYAAGPAAAHATAVARLVEAGAVPVGTTNLDQFATGLVGTRSPYGAPHAHGHPGWVSGGSSSGSGVVVAQGDVPVALATDTAGSGRVPAALNGLGAMKPTRGRVSAAGVVPACRSLDCVGTFAGNPADAAFVADVMAGPDPADPWSRTPPGGAATRAWPAPGRPGSDAPPRVGVARDADLWFAGDAVAAAAHAEATAAMRACGWELVEVDLAPFRAAGDLLYGGAFVAERFAAVGEAVRAGVAGLDPVVAGIIERAGDVAAWRAFADIDRLRGLRAGTAAVWVDVDALALPVVPTSFTHAAVAEDPLGTNTVLGTYTAFANLLDLCAAVAPVAPRADGHPWGVQLLGPAFADATVATLAHGLWAATAGPGAPPAPSGDGAVPRGMVPLVVAGAHLRGESLEHQVVECGGVWLGTLRTAARYALHLVTDDPPRPGLVEAGDRGAAIEVDVWALPPDGWTAFVSRGVPGLAVGRIELADGSVRPGFVAAADGTASGAGRQDLTGFGGWRAWRAAGAPRGPAA
jgi:allophanate hydrolase